MPISPRTLSIQEVVDKPDKLRPYLHHGVKLHVQGSHATGDCPFCGRENKFSVAVETGLWRCLVCGVGTNAGGGNALTFLRLFYADSLEARMNSNFLSMVAEDRRLAYSTTVDAWGVCPDRRNGTWLMPGYGIDGKLNQVYRRNWIYDENGGSWRLLPTPGIWMEGKVHQLHFAIGDFDPTKPNIIICEGPWDGMALWEIARLSDVNVIAVPGCNVWRNEWTTLCQGKTVTLMYDSDCPREHSGRILRAGFDGMCRVAKRLSGIASSIKWLRWGAEGYDPNKPSGWDVRDVLGGGSGPLPTVSQRREYLSGLLAKIEDVPKDLSIDVQSNGKVHHNVATTESQSCSTWAECESAWIEALQWRSEISHATAVLLAVCASTQQGGNQLFLQLVGSAGSGKTTLCEGLLVSRHCHHLEHLTGFHSGWKDQSGEGKDCSLISRINGKTLVTPEADVMMSSPRFTEIMSQQRRIFDGKSGATYKNSSEDTVYSGLRTPWIMAGTPALMDTDQSRLGDRFLRFIINDPPEGEKRSILRKALRSEMVAMLDTTNGTSASLVDPKMRRAHALTGGYVDWLRANVEEKLALVDINEFAEDRCIDLAELSADLRARPNEDRRKVEVHDSKELPTRLARQNIRMAGHLAVVLNKKSVDRDVLSIVRKLALDTANGHSLNITRWLCSPNPKMNSRSYQECGGLMFETLAMWTGMNNERLHRYLMFLRKIGVLDWHQVKQTNGTWLLTDRVYELYLRIMGD